MGEAKAKRHSRITTKVTRHLAVIYLVVYLLALCVLLCVVVPVMYNVSTRRAAETTVLVKNEIANMHETMAGYLNYLANSLELKAMLKPGMTLAERELVQQHLQSFISTQVKVPFVMIQERDGTSMRSFSHSDVKLFDEFVDSDEYVALLGKEYGTYVSPVYTGQVLNQTDFTDFDLAYMSKIFDVGSTSYIFTLFMDVGSYINRCEVLVGEKIDAYAMLDAAGNVMYANGEQGAEIPARFESTQGEYPVAGGRVFYSTNLATNWHVVAFSSTRTLLESLGYILFTMLALSVLAPLGYYIISLRSNARHLEPIRQLTSSMRLYSAGDTVRCDIKTDDEIEELSDAFNGMVAKINAQLDEIRAAERETSLTRYKLLTTQIDPHFIYNTMGIINVLARQGDSDAVIEVNSSLIKILQDRLSSDRSVFDSLENELGTLRQYVNIMNYRYKNNVKFVFDVDDSLSHVRIPKNIIQPFVENAFYHGLTLEDGVIEGQIDVIAYQSDGRLVLEISDNGTGMDAATLEGLTGHHTAESPEGRIHIGIGNVYKRLQYLYGNEELVTIHSSPGYGTTVVLSLPLDES